jgi:hypothetical protein
MYEADPNPATVDAKWPVDIYMEPSPFTVDIRSLEKPSISPVVVDINPEVLTKLLPANLTILSKTKFT